MSKLGRNDQCHCGSGKKYKKCCLEIDEAKARTCREEDSRELRAVFDERPSCSFRIDSEDDLFDEDFEDEISDDDSCVADFMSEYDRLEFDDKVAEFKTLIETKDELFPCVAFETIDMLQSAADTASRRQQVNGCIDLMRSACNEVFLDNAAYYADWYIMNSLADGRLAEMTSYFNAAAADAEKSIDVFTELIDTLAYHGQLSVLVEGMNLVWPVIRKSTGIMGWAVNEFAVTLSDYVAFEWLERAGRGEDAEFDELAASMREFFPELDIPGFREFLGRINGEIVTPWTMKELSPARKNRGNLGLLSQEFLGHLRQREGVSFTKGRLACFEIVDYLIERYDGELSMKGTVQKKGRKLTASHALCPDADTLDCFLARKTSIFSRRTYTIGAILELVPAWLRFLESRGLLEDCRKEDVLAELLSIRTSWDKILTKLSHDPQILSGISNAWNELAG
jgi:hypothetical protein